MQEEARQHYRASFFLPNGYLIGVNPKVVVDLKEMFLPRQAAISCCTKEIAPYRTATESYTTAIESCSGTIESYTTAIESRSGTIESYSGAIESCSVTIESYTTTIESCSGTIESYSTAIEACSVATGWCSWQMVRSKTKPPRFWKPRRLIGYLGHEVFTF